MTRIFWRIII